MSFSYDKDYRIIAFLENKQLETEPGIRVVVVCLSWPCQQAQQPQH